MLASYNKLGRISSFPIFWWSFCNISHYFFLKYLLDITHEIRILHFLVHLVSDFCKLYFSEMSPFYLNFQLYCHRIINVLQFFKSLIGL